MFAPPFNASATALRPMIFSSVKEISLLNLGKLSQECGFVELKFKNYFIIYKYYRDFVPESIKQIGVGFEHNSLQKEFFLFFQSFKNDLRFVAKFATLFFVQKYFCHAPICGSAGWPLSCVLSRMDHILVSIIDNSDRTDKNKYN